MPGQWLVPGRSEFVATEARNLCCISADTIVMMPVACRRLLVDLSDDVATKVQVMFYADAADALRKALHD